MLVVWASCEDPNVDFERTETPLDPAIYYPDGTVKVNLDDFEVDGNIVQEVPANGSIPENVNSIVIIDGNAETEIKISVDAEVSTANDNSEDNKMLVVGSTLYIDEAGGVVNIQLHRLINIELGGNSNVTLCGFNYDSLGVTIHENGSILFNDGCDIGRFAGVVSDEMQYLSLDIRSNGTFNGFNKEAQDASVLISANGTAEVFVNRSLNVTMTSNGKTFYKGNPSIDYTASGQSKLIDSN